MTWLNIRVDWLIDLFKKIVDFIMQISKLELNVFQKK